jgi:uncharacterized protein (UPF0216 family)
MYAQKINIEYNLSCAESQRLKREAEIEEQEYLISIAQHEWEEKKAQAEIIKLKAAIPTWEMNLKGAQAELATIQELMDELEPKRRYAHLPILEANEASQQEEWKLELRDRAENQMMAHALGINWDELETMRSHPEWSTELLPHIMKVADSLDRVHQARMQKSGAPVMLQIMEKLICANPDTNNR